MEQNQFKCSGDCLKCSPAQRAYCASQHSYSNMKVLDTMMALVLSMQESIMELGSKIEAIQNSEASIFDPSAVNSEESPATVPEASPSGLNTAQEGSGAAK